MSCLAKSTRRVWATAMGEAPRCCRNNRRSWRPPYAQAFRQCFHAIVIAVECTFGNESEGAGNRARSSPPRGQIRCGFRPTPQARAKTRFLGRRGRGKKAAILELRSTRRTDRPAIDAGRCNPNEQQAVETGIAALKGAITGLSIREFHAWILSHARSAVPRFSDVVIPPW